MTNEPSAHPVAQAGHGSPLFALREVLRQQGPASAEQLARRMRRPPAVVQAMLEHWRRRGRVLALPAEAAAGSGGACTGGTCAACGGCGSRREPASARYAWQVRPCFGLGAAGQPPPPSPLARAAT